MKNNNPIGIFDSGLGGLTVLDEVRKRLPQENLVYVADSAYAPYGEKEATTVEQRALFTAHYLTTYYQIKVLVVACNTATAAAVQSLRAQLDIPVVGMEPAIKPAVEQTQSGVVGVLATENTLASDKFSKLLDSHQHQARIIVQPCLGWVEAIEQGDLSKPNRQSSIKSLVADCVQPLLDEGADTFVLGCTHYPLLEPVIRDLVGSRYIISTGKAVAKQVENTLKQHQLFAAEDNAAKHIYYTSGEQTQFQISVAKLFARDIDVLALPSSL